MSTWKERLKALMKRGDADEQTADVASLWTAVGNHPARGLTPQKLANILESAQQGDLVAQADLFDDMEERDGHLFAELSKRRRSVLGLEWSLMPPRDASQAEVKAAADLDARLRDTLDMENVLFDLTDAIGKGFACLEIDWQRDGKGWWMQTLHRRPQRWFTVPQDNRNELRLRDNSAPNGAPLWPLGWMVHRHDARSGWLPETALFRVLAWPYLFKHYSLRDLAEFLEIYGLPLRLGKYPAGASKKEKATLMRAVMAVGHAAAGIIPQGMEIDFQNATEGRSDPFRAMMDWAEATTSKAIVGQTLTSQSGQNGEGSRALGEVHNDVRHDITVSDAKQLQPTLTQQLVQPLALLNGYITDPTRAPRFVFDVAETEDIKLYADSLPALVNIGVQIPKGWANEKLGIPVPAADDDVLQPAPVSPAPVALKAAQRVALKTATDEQPAAADLWAAQMTQAVMPQTNQWLDTLQSILDSASSLEEAQTLVEAAFSELADSDTRDTLTQMLSTAYAAGRYDVEQTSE